MGRGYETIRTSFMGRWRYREWTQDGEEGGNADIVKSKDTILDYINNNY